MHSDSIGQLFHTVLPPAKVEEWQGNAVDTYISSTLWFKEIYEQDYARISISCYTTHPCFVDCANEP